MRALLSFFLLFTTLCAFSFAEPLKLAELIDIALKNNPETQKVWWNAKRSQAALGIAQSDYYPSVNGKASGMHGREVKFPTGPNTNYTYYSGELSLNYLLFDFGERSASVSAAKEALKAAHWSSDYAIQRIIYQVAAHYYEYLNAALLLKTRECSLCDAETISKSAEEMFKAGLRCVTDINTSKAEFAHVQMELAQQRALVAIAYGKLMTTLGISIETMIEVDIDPQGMDNPLFSEGISKLIALANEQRKDLLAKKASLAEMKYRVQKEDSSKWPKMRALGQIGWLEYTKHQGSGYNYLTGLALDVPLFSGFERIYAKRVAYAQAEMTEAELRQLYESIALEVLTYSESVKSASDALSWSDEYLSEAAKSYDGSLESYKAGLQNIFDLLQTQRYLADARMKKTQARTQWLVSLSQLAFATGSTIQ
jgi:outer membrane protein